MKIQQQRYASIATIMVDTHSKFKFY